MNTWTEQRSTAYGEAVAIPYRNLKMKIPEFPDLTDMHTEYLLPGERVTKFML